MSIVTITSQNPNLSYVLAKNPVTILTEKKPFERELRKGKVYGWFTNKENTEFRLFFKDSEITCSFGNRQEFEYLDLSRYSNPYIPIMMINTALNSASSKEHELDTENFETSISFVIQCPLGILSRFSGMVGMNLSYELVSHNHFRVVVSDSGIMKVLNKAIIVCVIACLADEDTYVPLPEAGIIKYLNTLNRAKAPYYLRHLFVSRAISNRVLFDKLKGAGLVDVFGTIFQFGNTQVQRHDAIKEALFREGDKIGEGLIDIGCGDMYHSMKLMNKYELITVYEGDEEIHTRNVNKLAKKQIESITPFNVEVDAAWVRENAELFEDKDVLLSEVLEHREKEVSMELLRALLGTKANKVVITVPNKDFNKYYNLGETEFRHGDHKWEPTKIEFEASVDEAKGSRELRVMYVGDLVSEGDTFNPVCLLASFHRTN